MAGQTVSHYRVLRQIGSGGMGVVFEAADIKLGRHVALKFLPAASDEMARRRFEREARTASSLSHTHICTIYEVDEYRGIPFLAMELLDGGTLASHIAGRPLSSERILEWGTEMAEALEVAHAQGIIHRDIKPANVFITARGQVKVLDFGLAKVTGAHRAVVGEGTQQLGSDEPSTTLGTVVGTINYMSPEQARGEQLDARTDLFSFGTVLYEMSTGHQAFQGDTTAVIFEAILNRDPVPARQLNHALTPQLEHVIRTALEKDRDLRYQSAGEMRAELKRLRRDSSSVRITAASGEPALRDLRSRGALAAGLTAALLLLAIGGFTAYRLSRRPAFDLQDMRMIHVTNNGKASALAISPDGRYIVYVRAQSQQYRLLVRQIATGSDIEILTPGPLSYEGATFSPDGNYLYFVRTDKGNVAYKNLYQIPSLGGSQRQLLEDIETPISFAPDGRQFAILREGPGLKVQLVISSVDGGERILATLPARVSYGPAWSPDGKTIVVPGTVYPADFSSAISDVLYAVSVKDGSINELYRRSDHIGRPVWLPDGGGLLVVMTGGEDVSSIRGQLWEVDWPNGKASRIGNDLTNYDLCCLHLTRDGAALMMQEDSVAEDLSISPAGDIGNSSRIASGELFREVHWTPEGNLIFRAGDKFSLKLEQMDAMGTNRRRVVSTNKGSWAFSVCGDGEHILYDEAEGDKSRIVRAQLDGSNPASLGAGGLSPDCSPDGTWLIYFAEGRLWRMPIEGGEPKLLASDVREDYGISPDGKLVFYESRLPRNAVVIKIINAESGAAVASLPGPIEVESRSGFVPPPLCHWSPDGKAIQYRLPRNGVDNIWEQPLNGRAARQITNFNDSYISWFEWSRDGKHLVLSRGEIRSDVILMSKTH